MRLNKYIALHTGISRRTADRLIQNGGVMVNDKRAALGQTVSDTDIVSVNGQPIRSDIKVMTIMLNKPVGYVVSRDGQGSKTVYDLLPEDLHNLKPVGRLDKDSSGLLLLTNDGKLANELTHPSSQKRKIYEIELNKSLAEEDFNKITKTGVNLEDGSSKFQLNYINNSDKHWVVTMREGRTRQIRRTFAALGYEVTKLHRTDFGQYKLADLKESEFYKNLK